MRKIVASFIYSIDGVTHSPQDWIFDRYNDEMAEYFKAMIDRQDALLLGRRTYDGWSQYWPESTHEPFASFINNTPKYIASTTLTEVSWQNSTLIGEDFIDRIAAMKKEPGKDIGVHGSVTIVQSLLREGLLDELKLAVFPVIADGASQADDPIFGDAGPRRLFEGFGQVRRLHLADVEKTGTGIVLLTYQPHPA